MVIGDCLLWKCFPSDPGDTLLDAGNVTLSDEHGTTMSLQQIGNFYDAHSIPAFGTTLQATSTGGHDIPAFTLAAERPSLLSTASSSPSGGVLSKQGMLSISWATDPAERGFVVLTAGEPLAETTQTCSFPIGAKHAEIPASTLAFADAGDNLFARLSTSCGAHETKGSIDLRFAYEQRLPEFALKIE
jgi:hypothetical protein